MDSKSVLIDNDFLQKALEMNQEEEKILYILSELFCCLELSPVIHPLVREHEVIDTNITEKVLNNIIDTPTWQDIHQNNTDKKNYYTFLVMELYTKMFGTNLEMGEKDVFTYWRRRCSLGEIHALATCMLCECGMFLSDDKDSKKLQNIIEYYFSKRINVYTREEIKQIAKENDVRLSRKELQSFAHQT